MIIKNILIGEDIRQEVGNKLSMMGILGDSINIEIVPDAPKDIALPIILSSLITIENEQVEPINNFKIEISMKLGEQEIAKMGAQMGADGSPKLIHIPVPKFEFITNKSNTLTINAKILKNNELISDYSSYLDVNINRR